MGSRVCKLHSRQYYMRDQWGRELAVYNLEDNKVKYYNLYANGLVGRIEPHVTDHRENDTRFYYFKDHLSNIRRVYREDGTLMAAVDYCLILQIDFVANVIAKYIQLGLEQNIVKKKSEIEVLE